MTPFERVQLALRHIEPDRVPVDFLATTEVWNKLIAHLNPLERRADADRILAASEFVEPGREAIMRQFEIDVRLLSYDMFCAPPETAMKQGAFADWWISLARSTPNRMWVQYAPDGTWFDIWGVHYRRVEHEFGAYQEFASFPLSDATSLAELRAHPWATPDWWDFSPVPRVIQTLDPQHEYYWRFRIGSVFEIAWALRGMQEFLIDLASQPEFPQYIMERLTEVYLENTRRMLEIAGEHIDMVYFYDDVATQNSLMISKQMWQEYVRPHHAKLIDLAHSFGKKVMYHCDGAIYPLIPELIELGVDLLNPIQPDAKGMDSRRLKEQFGDRLCFHGGVDIIKTLPRGTREEVIAEVRERVNVLGKGGGYILCSSHHIQPDTPVENVLTMYEPGLRYGTEDG
jgi:uroporphyrinogen decarboxylase